MPKRKFIRNDYIYVLYGKQFYIIFDPVRGYSETSIIKGMEFLTLRGDFRKQFEKIIDDGYEVCVDFYNKQDPKKKSFISIK